MEIIIRLDAGHKKGLGHLFRMLVLKRVFDHHGLTCCFVVRSNKVALKILDHENVTYLSFSQSLDEKEIIDAAVSRLKNPGAWIFDLLGTESQWLSAVKTHGIPVVSLDDLRDGPRGADLVINPIFGCRQDVRDQFKDFHHVKNGPEYAILDPDLSGLPAPPMPEGVFKLGISMGGSDTYGATVALAETLTRLENNNLQIHLFLGPHFLHQKELNAAIKGFEDQYITHKAVQDLPRGLNQMHAVICSGGQTLFEMLTMGMPVFALANEPHEEHTINFFARKKACICLGSIHKKPKETILLETLGSMINSYSAFSTMGVTAKKIIDGQGAARCAEMIMSLSRQRKNQ